MGRGGKEGEAEDRRRKGQEEDVVDGCLSEVLAAARARLDPRLASILSITPNPAKS
jgi:hypothetical protein